MKLTVNSSELGKVLANALAFCPAKSKFPAIEIRSGGFALTALASDTYTVGRSWMATEGADIGRVTLALKDAQAVEKLARMDRKGTGRDSYGNGTLEIEPGLLTFSPELAGEPLTLPGIDVDAVTAYGAYAELWEACSDLLERVEPNAVYGPPEAALFDPALMARFAKVKASTADSEDVPVMDMLFQQGLSPILVKIGSNFRGALMPISRTINRERQGSAGHW